MKKELSIFALFLPRLITQLKKLVPEIMKVEGKRRTKFTPAIPQEL